MMTCKGLIWFLVLGVVGANAYKNCYYCYVKNLGYCAQKEINIHRQHCPSSGASKCHTISSVTIHSGNGRTLIKHCNETISTCENMPGDKSRSSTLLLCCSSCDNSSVKMTPNLLLNLGALVLMIWIYL